MTHVAVEWSGFDTHNAGRHKSGFDSTDGAQQSSCGPIITVPPLRDGGQTLLLLEVIQKAPPASSELSWQLASRACLPVYLLVPARRLAVSSAADSEEDVELQQQQQPFSAKASAAAEKSSPCLSEAGDQRRHFPPFYFASDPDLAKVAPTIVLRAATTVDAQTEALGVEAEYHCLPDMRLSRLLHRLADAVSGVRLRCRAVLPLPATAVLEQADVYHALRGEDADETDALASGSLTVLVVLRAIAAWHRVLLRYLYSVLQLPTRGDAPEGPITETSATAMPQGLAEVRPSRSCDPTSSSSSPPPPSELRVTVHNLLAALFASWGSTASDANALPSDPTLLASPTLRSRIFFRAAPAVRPALQLPLSALQVAMESAMFALQQTQRGATLAAAPLDDGMAVVIAWAAFLADPHGTHRLDLRVLGLAEPDSTRSPSEAPLSAPPQTSSSRSAPLAGSLDRTGGGRTQMYLHSRNSSHSTAAPAERDASVSCDPHSNSGAGASPPGPLDGPPMTPRYRHYTVRPCRSSGQRANLLAPLMVPRPLGEVGGMRSGSSAAEDASPPERSRGCFPSEAWPCAGTRIPQGLLSVCRPPAPAPPSSELRLRAGAGCFVEELHEALQDVYSGDAMMTPVTLRSPPHLATFPAPAASPSPAEPGAPRPSCSAARRVARRCLRHQLEAVHRGRLFPTSAALEELNTLPYCLYVWCYSYDPLADDRRHRSYTEPYASRSTFTHYFLEGARSLWNVFASGGNSNNSCSSSAAVDDRARGQQKASAASSSGAKDPTLYLSVCALYLTEADLVLRLVPHDEKGVTAVAAPARPSHESQASASQEGTPGGGEDGGAGAAAEVLVLPRVAIAAVTRYTVNRASEGVFSERCAHKMFIVEPTHGGARCGYPTLRPYLAQQRQQARAAKTSAVPSATTEPSLLARWARGTLFLRGSNEERAAAASEAPQAAAALHGPRPSSPAASRCPAVVLKLVMTSLRTVWLEFADEETLSVVCELLQRPPPRCRAILSPSTPSAAVFEEDRSHKGGPHDPGSCSSSTAEHSTHMAETAAPMRAAGRRPSGLPGRSDLVKQSAALLRPLTGNRLVVSARRPALMLPLVLVCGDVLPPAATYSAFFTTFLRNIMTATAVLNYYWPASPASSPSYVRESGGSGCDGAADVGGRRAARAEESAISVHSFATNEELTLPSATAAAPAPRLTQTWWLYDPRREFLRQSLVEGDGAWTLTDVNEAHTFSPTYPACFTVPSSLHASLQDGSISGWHRMNRRVELASYVFAPTGGTLVRSAQPALARQLMHSAASSVEVAAQALSTPEPASAKDMKSRFMLRLLQAFAAAAGLPLSRVVVMDLRSPSAAHANAVRGGGSMAWFTECPKVEYAHLGNIFAVRDAWQQLCATLRDGPLVTSAGSHHLLRSGEPPYAAVVAAAETGSRGAAQPTAGRVLHQPATGSCHLGGNQLRPTAEYAWQLDEPAAVADASNDADSGPTASSAAASSDSGASDARPLEWLRMVHGLLHTAVVAARRVVGVPVDLLYPPAQSRGGVRPNCFSHIVGRHFTAVPLMPSTGGHNAWTAAAEAGRGRPSGSGGGGGALPSYGAEAHAAQAHIVLLNCSDGWDRTSQVAALAQLLIDPYYRTIEGLCVLIEKDFVAAGHPARRRASTVEKTPTTASADGFARDARAAMDEGDGASCEPTLHSPESSAGARGAAGGGGGGGVGGAHKSREEHAPVLLQFFDALWQLVRLYPLCFEFTEAFVLMLVDLMHAGVVSTFAVDCEAEVERERAADGCLSISQWCALLLATRVNPAAATARSNEGEAAGPRRGVTPASSVLHAPSFSYFTAISSQESFTRVDSQLVDPLWLGVGRADLPSADDAAAQRPAVAQRNAACTCRSAPSTATPPPRQTSGPDNKTQQLDNAAAEHSTRGATAALAGDGATPSVLTCFDWTTQLPSRRSPGAIPCTFEPAASPRPPPPQQPPHDSAHAARSSAADVASPIDFQRRLLPITRDAVLYSGYVNPEFSLRFNALVVGPLVDYVALTQLTLWEDNYLRHSQWEERRVRLRRQAPCTAFAVAPSAQEAGGTRSRAASTPETASTDGVPARAAAESSPMAPWADAGELEAHGADGAVEPRAASTAAPPQARAAPGMLDFHIMSGDDDEEDEDA